MKSSESSESSEWQKHANFWDFGAQKNQKNQAYICKIYSIGDVLGAIFPNPCFLYTRYAPTVVLASLERPWLGLLASLANLAGAPLEITTLQKNPGKGKLKTKMANAKKSTA